MSVQAALIAAIVEEPDDLERYAVYADWLQQCADPRAELMVLQVAHERGVLPPDAERRLRKLLSRQALVVSPDLRAHLDAWRLTFRRGFVREAVHQSRLHVAPAPAVEALFADPHAVLLDVRLVAPDAVAAALARPRPSVIAAHLAITTAVGELECFPALERLALRDRQGRDAGDTIEHLAHPRLRTLHTSVGLPALLDGRFDLPALEELGWLPWIQQPGEDLAAAGSIFQRPPPSLVRMAFRSSYADDVASSIGALARLAVARQLVELTLDHVPSWIDELDIPSAFPALRRLVVDVAEVRLADHPALGSIERWGRRSQS